MRKPVTQQVMGPAIFVSHKSDFKNKTNSLLTIIVLFCVVPFFNNCFACSNYNWSTDNEAADLHRKGTGLSNLKQKICGNDADEGTLQVTTWDRGATQWACSTSQWGEQWWKEELKCAEGCIWEGGCIHQGETEQFVVSSGTDSRCKNLYAFVTWLRGRWRHRRWSQVLEAFAREISEWGDADSGDFGSTVCSTATRRCSAFG